MSFELMLRRGSQVLSCPRLAASYRPDGWDSVIVLQWPQYTGKEHCHVPSRYQGLHVPLL